MTCCSLASNAEQLLHVDQMGENPHTGANRARTPGILPKWVSRLFFVILWPVETVGKNQFYLSQNALKLTCSNVEFQQFSAGETPGPPLQELGRGLEGREGKEG